MGVSLNCGSGTDQREKILALRSLRKDIAAAGSGFSIAAFGTRLWISQSYLSSHPRMPIPDQGLVHAINNHGSHVYLTDTEVTGLALLWIAFLVGVLLWGIIAIGLAESDRVATARSSTILACSTLVSVGAIYFVGQSIAAFAVSHGVILNF
jgi:hypothetical protein